jgi:broad specificity phosphatase PhoE
MIWLVRHGESEANAGMVVSDYATIPLTARGHRQAEAVAEVCSPRPGWIARSPYTRAQQTAEALILRAPGTLVYDLPVQEFTYINPEACRNTDTATRQLLVDAYWSRMDPEYQDGDGAESFVQLLQRAQGFLQVVESWAGFGVVYTHEQFIRAVLLTVMYHRTTPALVLMRRFFALRTGLPIPNASIVPLNWDGNRWWIASIDTTHLDGVTPR